MASLPGLAGPQVWGCVKRQPTWACTGAAIAAAPAQESTHHALAADRHALRTVDEDFDFNRACLCNRPDLRQGKFSRKDHPVVPHLCQLARTLRRMDGHLGGPVQRKAGRDLFDHYGDSQVIGNHGVGTGFGHGAHCVGQAGKLPGKNQGVEGDMHAYAARVAKRNGPTQLFRRKVSRGAPGVKTGQPQINSISAA